MDNLYEDVLEINNKWDIEDVKLIFQRGLMGQKSALTPSVKKDEIIDNFIIMCKSLIKESTELDSTDKVGDKNITNTTVTPTEVVNEEMTPARNDETNDVNIVTKSLTRSEIKSKRICRAYKQHVCSFGRKGEGCPFAHPPKCQTFCNYRLSIFNSRGCDQTKCEFLHPKLCLHVIKNGKC